jgi:hypothetical protein
MTDDPIPPSPLPQLSLQDQAQILQQEIATLQQERAKLQQQLGQLVQESLADLQKKKQSLQASIEQLERRQASIQAEMRKNFAGASQEVVTQVQGFKDYLINSLQDLVTTTEQLNLLPSAPAAETPTVSRRASKSNPAPVPAATPQTAAPSETRSSQPQFSQQEFVEETRQIRRLIEQYRQNPNYYGPPWQLRRTFEAIHAERVASWFFNLGGRGALRSLNSRLQNILVASAVTSILYHLYGGALKVLILADSPERLGDWRRGLQDCLGISRPDFSPEGGVSLFESADALSARADRLMRDDQVPLILIDDSEDTINLAMLQFPLLLAFAPEPQPRQSRGNFDFFE